MPTGIELFKQRFEGYEGEVVFVESEQAAMQKALDIIKETQSTSVGISLDAGMAPMLDNAGIQWIHELPENKAVPKTGITRAAGLVVETGSLVINERAGERLWSIICDIHIAILVKPMIFDSLDDLFAGKSPLPDMGLCLVSGPSRTADIEKQLVLGMHGPKRVIAIIAG